MKRITKKLEERVKNDLRNEVKVYDDYLTGNVYGFYIKKDDEIMESCFGFYGDDGLQEARRQAMVTIDAW